ncbi:MAG: hypothetical protein WC373_08980 [Smithella sp.]|jgi:hypothetical protein
MKKLNWLITIITLTCIILSIAVLINFYVDTYGIRTSLFSTDKNTGEAKFVQGINERIFNVEYIFRHPDKYDSFLFGSSRTGLINVGKINSDNFYNMSYNGGIPSEHLMIIKTFLKKGIKIKLVVIGLDEFSFSRTHFENEKLLLRQMHPYITGKSLAGIFSLYYFRMPQLFELADLKDKLLSNEKYKFILDKNGTNLGWMNIEKEIITSGKPSYTDKNITYDPFKYNEMISADVFSQIKELISLSKKHDFRLIFFINPVRGPEYLNYALNIIPIKEKLAVITDFYDFSGFNSVTTDNINYLDNSHYRYFVGDFIIERIFNIKNIPIPDDFGVLVTKNNINKHIKMQKQELGKFLVTIKDKKEKS